MSDGLHHTPVPVSTEQNYPNVLRRIDDFWTPAWYRETGTSTGKGLAKLRGEAMAVEPKFRLADLGSDRLAGREQLHLFQMTSDAFSETSLVKALAAPVNIVFLHGLHLLAFLLRDRINAERFCHALAEALTMTSQTDPSLAPYTGPAA